MKVLSQLEFWNVCCNYAFVRTGPQQGWIRNQLFVTFDPPDEEFLRHRVVLIHELLNAKPVEVEHSRSDTAQAV